MADFFIFSAFFPQKHRRIFNSDAHLSLILLTVRLFSVIIISDKFQRYWESEMKDIKHYIQLLENYRWRLCEISALEAELRKIRSDIDEGISTRDSLDPDW